MPLIVIGADTHAGEAILQGLDAKRREIRAFVSDEATGLALREDGFKVAIGDVSDESHVEAAATRCFSAVLIAEAAHDARERSFADDPAGVLRGWANAVANSNVRRVIWVTTANHPETTTTEVVSVDPSESGFVERVIELDEAASLT